MSKEIIDLLERIVSFAAKRANVHFQFAKEKEDDGAMFFTEDYKAYVSILDDATTVLTLLKQQPPEGEYDTRTIENTEVCPCGNIFVEADDYDTLGSESGVCCPKCGNEKFQTVKSLLDTSEARVKDLLEALEKVQQYRKAAEKGRLDTHNAHEYWESVMSYVDAAIAKANKKGQIP